MMGVEIRKIETTYGETGVGQQDRVDVTYELGFETPSGGWVKFIGVPESTVQRIEDAAKGDDKTGQENVDLSQPAGNSTASDTVAPASSTTGGDTSAELAASGESGEPATATPDESGTAPQA